MYETIKKEVLDLLGAYPSTKKKIALLRYELEHPQQIDTNALIESLTFSHGDGESVRMPSHISNKTMFIAMNYQEAAHKIEHEALDDISSRLYALEYQVNKLHHCVSLLEDRHQAIITLFFFERKTWDEITDTLGLAYRTARKLKEAAIDELVAMYAFTK
ncbi:hypothetical protein RFF05_13850 [Bengtsoniella intestinalis]|uniref:hypothetical protein n=1 Tax=Bengtsoniella intestinalis TaxID=3073143 RepID=UPI00391EF778